MREGEREIEGESELASDAGGETLEQKGTDDGELSIAENLGQIKKILSTSDAATGLGKVTDKREMEFGGVDGDGDAMMVDANNGNVVIGELAGQEPVKSAGHVVEEREDQQPFPIESSVSLSVEFSGILRAHANCVFFCMHT